MDFNQLKETLGVAADSVGSEYLNKNDLGSLRLGFRPPKIKGNTPRKLWQRSFFLHFAGNGKAILNYC